DPADSARVRSGARARHARRARGARRRTRGSGLSPASVLEILAALERAGVAVWLDGGWGVGALLGEGARAHRDLGLSLSQSAVAALRGALGALGFAERADGSATNFVLADARGREVDVHAIEFDARGYGSFALPDGGRWPFPPSAFAGRGGVAG